VFLGGIFQSTTLPANQAMIPAIFTRERAGVMVSLNSVAFNTARFIGPALALPLLDRVGIGAVFVANCVSFLPPIVAFSAYAYVDRNAAWRPHAVARTPDARSPPSLFGDFRAGVRIVAASREVRGLLVLTLVISLFGRSVVELLPALADVLLHRPADGAMVLMSASGIGALAGGLGFSFVHSTHARLRVLVWTSLLLAISLLALPVVKSFWLAVVVVATCNLSAVVNGLVVIVLLQELVATVQRGRLMSFYFSVFRGGVALGALAGGALFDALSATATLLLLGAGTAIAAMSSFRYAGANRRLK
jgi:predicted MFS family arabinose efflux permease